MLIRSRARVSGPQTRNIPFLVSIALLILVAAAAPAQAGEPQLKAPPSIADVPQPAQWVWDRAWIPRATPAWLVAIDDTVVLTVVGLEQWESNVRPLLERIAEERIRLRRQAQR
jgi:hypothetical protein